MSACSIEEQEQLQVFPVMFVGCIYTRSKLRRDLFILSTNPSPMGWCGISLLQILYTNRLKCSSQNFCPGWNVAWWVTLQEQKHCPLIIAQFYLLSDQPWQMRRATLRSSLALQGCIAFLFLRVVL